MLIQSALVALAAPLAAAVTPLEIRGNEFVHPKTGNKFQLVGIDYQPGGAAGYKPNEGKDPLSDADICLRDAALMQILGVNAIRVYNLDPSLNHDACASIFNAAGMYMLIDVNSPLDGESLARVNPWESYHEGYLTRTFQVVEAFKSYPNTLLFFSGNEVIDKEESAEFCPRYVRSVTRDLRNYIKKHSERYIPVGYSAADVRPILFDTWNYFQCDDGDGGDADSSVDLFALNSYSWCGDSNFDKSTYDDLVAGFKGTSVPIFFSEFGCNEVTPRVFTEIGTIYGPQMTGVFSGGMLYEYSMEPNKYGVVEIYPNNSAKLLGEYETLANQYKKLDFAKLQGQKPSSGAAPTAPACDQKLITNSFFDKNFTAPEMPADDSAKILAAGVSPAPVGKIIPIDNYKVKFDVYDAKGNLIKDLAVTPLEEANQPGSNTGSSSVVGDGDDNAGLALRPALLGLALPLLAVFFA